MLGQGQEVTADQQRLIALAFSQSEVTAVTFQSPGGELLAPDTVSETTGVVVVLQIWLGCALGVAFQLEQRSSVVVIAPGNPTGTGCRRSPKRLITGVSATKPVPCW